MPQNNNMLFMLDAMMTTQRAYFDFWTRAFNPPRRDFMPTFSHQQPPTRENVREDQQVIGIGEEVLEVSARPVIGQTTRVRRVVTAAPVEQQIQLHDTTIIVERRPAHDGEIGDDSLAEREYVMYDVSEVPVVNKRTRVREMVVLRREHNHRTEVVRGIVRRADVQVEEPERVPMVIMPQPHGETANGEEHDEVRLHQSQEKANGEEHSEVHLHEEHLHLDRVEEPPEHPVRNWSQEQETRHLSQDQA